jgi:hypothetical protein
MIVTKKDLSKLASKKEISRVMKKFSDREQTKIELLTGEIKVISKTGGGYELP